MSSRRGNVNPLLDGGALSEVASSLLLPKPYAQSEHQEEYVGEVDEKEAVIDEPVEEHVDEGRRDGNGEWTSDGKRITVQPVEVDCQRGKEEQAGHEADDPQPRCKVEEQIVGMVQIWLSCCRLQYVMLSILIEEVVQPDTKKWVVEEHICAGLP